MAHQAMGRAPWNRRNKQEQGLLISHPRYSDILNNKRPSLVSTVQPASLWPHLRKYNVVGESLQDRMTLNLTRFETVEKLLDHVERGPTWQLHSFLRSCSLTDQDHIIREIGLDPEVYNGRSDSEDDSHAGVHVPKASTSVQSTSVGAASAKQPSRTFSHPLLAIQYHRDVYNRTLMRGRLFDIPSLDLPYDMEWCYMKVVATSDERLQNPVDILPADILKTKPGKPRLKTVLLSGHPGTGKSSFIRFYGHKWSQMKAGESEWDLIVILNVSTLKLTEGLLPKEHTREAIIQSLEGRGDKEAIMKSMDDESLNVLVIPDGMDECHSVAVLDMLRELISSSYNGELSFTVLATCRTGLCPIKESLFDRQMKIDGFKTHEGVQYVQRFYEHIQAPDDDTVYEYIANNQEDLNHILTNPLCTHILSVVTADGTLKLTKGQRLRLKDLFMAMEKSMKRRQLEKLMQEGTESMPKKERLEDEIKYFYNMSLWALLQDVRTFDDHIMDKFGINAYHPYLTFMTKTKKYNSDLQDVSYWRFNHEIFHEHFAASALEALPEDLCSTVLLIISSHRQFRNTQRILFSALGGDIGQLPKLTDMIRANLIMQGQWHGSDTVTKGIIQDIKGNIEGKLSVDRVDILDTLTPGEQREMSVDTSCAQAVWQTVRGLYEDGVEGLQEHGFHYDEVNTLLHVYQSLCELPEEHKKLVFAESLGRTMPSERLDHNGNRSIVYNTGGTRWVKITEEGLGVNVHIRYSLTDVSEAVKQYGQKHFLTWMKEEDTTVLDTIWLHINMSHSSASSPGGTAIWGEPQCEQFLSTGLWSDLLSDISDWPVTANRLYLQFDEDRMNGLGVLGFLKCLQMERTQDALRWVLVQDEAGRLKIWVYNGHIDSESLLVWTAWYLQQDLLQVWLVHMTCQVTATDSTSRQKQRRRVEQLQDLEHNGCKLLYDVHIKQPQGSESDRLGPEVTATRSRLCRSSCTPS